MCAITTKVLQYEDGHDYREIDISKFAYGVGTSHVCATQYTKVSLASLECVDMASGTWRSKDRAQVTWTM
jgi:hypothetical protein